MKRIILGDVFSLPLELPNAMKGERLELALDGVRGVDAYLSRFPSRGRNRHPCRA